MFYYQRFLSTTHCLTAPIIFLLITLALPANAGGFQLSDHSITALGRSQSGYGVVGDDASAAYFNPAGMTLLSEPQWQVGAAFIRAQGQFTNTGSTGVNTGRDADGAQDSITPNLYWIKPLSDQLFFGLGLTSPFGTHTDYPSDFIGRYNGRKTYIETVNINSSIAYKLTHTIALGFGLNYQTFDSTLSSNVSPAAANSLLTIEGESVAWGYNLGAMFTFTDNSRLGISYRSKVKHEIDGTAIFSGLGAADGRFNATAHFTTPETTYIAYTTSLSDDWRLSLGYRLTKWSRFQRFDVLFPTGTASQSSSILANWKNVETINMGLDYTINHQWTVRAGIALDETPIPASTRSVRTVDSDRRWYSLGAGYRINDHIKLDVAYRYIDFDNTSLNQDITRAGASIGSLIGEYNHSNVHTLAAQINYQF